MDLMDKKESARPRNRKMSQKLQSKVEEQRVGCNEKIPWVFNSRPSRNARPSRNVQRAAVTSLRCNPPSPLSTPPSTPLPSKPASKSVNPARSFSPVFDTNAIDYDIPSPTIPSLPLADAIDILKADKEKLRALAQSQTQTLISMDRSMLALRRQVALSQANVDKLTDKLKKIKAKIEKVNEIGIVSKDLKCRVCFDGWLTHVIIPCFHLVTCEACSEAIESCAVCRVTKQGTRKILWR
jgi:Zinc finger, C3HC4 type (RING finger)